MFVWCGLPRAGRRASRLQPEDYRRPGARPPRPAVTLVLPPDAENPTATVAFIAVGMGFAAALVFVFLHGLQAWVGVAALPLPALYLVIATAFGRVRIAVADGRLRLIGPLFSP